jgi:hypothetical protein
VPNFKNIFSYLLYFGFGEGSKHYTQGVSDILSVQYWTIYFKFIIERGISLSYFFIFMASAFAFLLSKDKRLSKDYWILLFWFISGYILLSLPQSKGNEGYTLPILAPIAIMMAIHTIKISLKPLRLLILFLALAAGIINFTYQTVSERCQYERFSLKGIPILMPLHGSCAVQYRTGAAYDKDWDLMSILQAMDRLNHESSRTNKVLLAVSHHLLNTNNMRLSAFIGQLKNQLTPDFFFDTITFQPPSKEVLKQMLMESHFVITKTGYQGPEWANENNPLVMELLKGVTPLESLAMSDGSMVFIYPGGLRE